MAKAARRSTRTTKAPARDPREAIIDAFLALAAERDVHCIGLDEIAERAGVSLAELRGCYAGKLGILLGFARRVDLAVLAEGPADPESEARDRLFEVMMRRFDALAPYKPAIRRMARSARCDPALAAILRRLAIRAQAWNLAAAGISHGGLSGRVKSGGLALVYGETMRTWLGDDDPDLGRTMATLDRALRRGERGMRMMSDLCSLLPRLAESGRRGRAAATTG
ncbi:MAG: TetR/AcrR family transcriptional regulator [Bauldia sp.]|uniref:TetR/AcrR family transcriptional regulator n=1 Tax=Bauldia sp. TaxID=2575872 RepID=UPI001D8E7CF9|nr:TetR/AcrR family transcriptional regulator [Bauldia sp.]MCB1496883.1 TetR/AcrR family transcriptional regulator [Bauldia sp.]